MKNILLLVHDDAGQEARFQAALDIVRALDGHLACIDVTPYPVIAGETAMGYAETVVVFDERDSEAKNKSALTDRLSREDVSWSWADTIGEMAASVLDAADLADLIILNRALGAWDGGRSAAAALRAAVPLLALANEVEIFTAREDELRNGPDQAATYLSRHGIHARVKIVDKDGRADKLIAAEAQAGRADYIVMGAYGRGRVMETFGGVTKRMLQDSKLPLLLGH